jgi:RNA polymerase sigma-70 factor, ECF subfamily
LEEKELVERSTLGNKSALNTLLQLNYKTLYGFVMKMTANETLAQDIAQDTLLKAVLNISKFNANCKFSTWLIKISINVYRDYLKKTRNVEYMEDVPCSISTVESYEEKIIIQLQYEEALGELRRLPYKQRTAFILKHYYGYSLEEISEIMDCPTGTIKSRISNCIVSLKKALQT